MEFIQGLLSSLLLFTDENVAEIKPYAVWSGDVSNLKIPHFVAAGAGDQWPKPCPALETLSAAWILLGLNVQGLLLFP